MSEREPVSAYKGATIADIKSTTTGDVLVSFDDGREWIVGASPARLAAAPLFDKDGEFLEIDV
jgi:hypothetical protein